MKMNKLQKLEIQNKANSFRKDFGYGETDPIRLVSFLLKQNILTVFKPLSNNLAGMAIKASTNDLFIMINQNHILSKQHFTIAHELYHLFVQENFTSQRCVTGLFDKQTDIEEEKADCFAANLLLPQLGVYELIPDNEKKVKNKISKETIFKIQDYYSVSINAVIYRLVDLELVDKTYFEIYNQLSKKQLARLLGYDIRLYEKGNIDRVIGNYGTIANKLFEKSLISESFYFELLNTIAIDPFNKDDKEDE
ncbi:ImmA/IrrE family metallo-endopeptidase [Flavobacterium sp. XS2P24]|nr:ImmA/IrrE family metallo-endopeptidase [Flavobacterium sp. XS2P24]